MQAERLALSEINEVGLRVGRGQQGWFIQVSRKAGSEKDQIPARRDVSIKDLRE